MDNLIKWAYYVFAIIYTFKVWGVGWGIISIIFPIFPLIDLGIYLVALVA